LAYTAHSIRFAHRHATTTEPLKLYYYCANLPVPQLHTFGTNTPKTALCRSESFRSCRYVAPMAPIRVLYSPACHPHLPVFITCVSEGWGPACACAIFADISILSGFKWIVGQAIGREIVYHLDVTSCVRRDPSSERSHV